MKVDSYAANLPLITRVRLAKAFLKDNPTEKPIAAARIFALYPSTLYSSLDRSSTIQHSGHNKVLQEHYKEALHQFIRSLLSNGIQPTYQLIYNSICNLKRAQDPTTKAPSFGQFSSWQKNNGLHKIKLKLITVVRLTAQHE